MFRFERLHDNWIGSCAAYLRTLFGEELRGKTVIDYAFGRGNWSLAFLLAGADDVIAIDASVENVARFKNYCRSRKITNIRVLLGDILRQNLPVRGDVIWLYGILPHIAEQEVFLNRIKTLASGPDALLYVYYFNANSLREFTVQTCRRVVIYKSESEFAKESFLFIRPARMRARDDLTAPYTSFYTVAAIRALLHRCGIYIKRQDEDFQFFVHGKVTEDFYPHQFLCSLHSKDDIAIEEPETLYASEMSILHEMARAVFSLPLTKIEKKTIAIGLYNTHFAFLRDGIYAHGAVIELFLFLMSILFQKEGASNVKLSSLVRRYWKLFGSAVAGYDRSRRMRHISKEMAGNILTDYLLNNNCRI